MNRYSDVDCPICGKPLDNGELVVVCPECGAPYHKECYIKKGSCIFTQLHETGESWNPPKKEQKYDGKSELRCSRCGTINPPYGIFCQVCGNQLNTKEENEQESDYPPPPFFFQGGFPEGIPLNPFTTPFGGVAPDEVIDGIPAKDLATFVGRNSHYYLPKFKDISNKKTKCINWGAFFFQGGYFLYRKMYLVGIIVIIINALLSIPSLYVLYQTIVNAAAFSPSASRLTENTDALNMGLSFLALGFRLLCGMYANTLYKKYVYKRITKLKEDAKRTAITEDEYYATLASKGSVNIKLITILLVCYVVLNFIAMYAMLFLQLNNFS